MERGASELPTVQYYGSWFILSALSVSRAKSVEREHDLLVVTGKNEEESGCCLIETAHRYTLLHRYEENHKNI
jgi:hypothetical protein